MNKQEMAEWLAKEVLGWNRYENEHGAWWVNSVNNNILPREVESFIYSPDGFFAVWDAVEGDKCVGMEMYIPPDEDLRGEAYSCTIRNLDQGATIKCGKDRYEAFYEAVFEAKTENKLEE